MITTSVPLSGTRLFKYLAVGCPQVPGAENITRARSRAPAGYRRKRSWPFRACLIGEAACPVAP